MTFSCSMLHQIFISLFIYLFIVQTLQQLHSNDSHCSLSAKSFRLILCCSFVQYTLFKKLNHVCSAGALSSTRAPLCFCVFFIAKPSYINKVLQWVFPNYDYWMKVMCELCCTDLGLIKHPVIALVNYTHKKSLVTIFCMPTVPYSHEPIL